MSLLSTYRYRRGVMLICVGAILLPFVSGCAPAEPTPAVPPQLPPVPPRPANAGSGAARYQQLMNESPDKAKNAAPK